jgi:hypothetical protein
MKWTTRLFALTQPALLTLAAQALRATVAQFGTLLKGSMKI